jgi:hypothetical protein
VIFWERSSGDGQGMGPDYQNWVMKVGIMVDFEYSRWSSLMINST